MTAAQTANLGVPATREHLDVYNAFLTRVLAEAARYEIPRRSLGPFALEEFHRQTQALETAKREDTGQFDLRNEVSRFIQTIRHNFDVMREKHDGFREQFDKDFERIRAVPKSERHLVWMTPYGKSLVQRAFDFGAVTYGSAVVMPMRARALQATMVSTVLGINLPMTPDALKYALEALWLSYGNYYGDRHALLMKLAPVFNEQAKAVFDMLESIDERIVAKEAAEARAAEERENASRQAELSMDDDEDTPLSTGSGHRGIAHAPVEPDTYDWSWDQDDTSHYQVNPASGLPMSNYGVDVMGNPYGIDYFN